MDTSGTHEAESNLNPLLDRLAQGRQITITRNGVPVARLVPIASGNGGNVKSIIQEVRRFRQGRSLGDLSIREMIEEGRRS